MNAEERIARKMHEMNLSPTLGKDDNPWDKLPEWKRIHFRQHARNIIKILNQLKEDKNK